MFPPRAGFEPDALVFECPGQLARALRSRRRARPGDRHSRPRAEDSSREVREKKLSLSRAALSGGLVRSKTTTVTQQRLCARDRALPPAQPRRPRARALRESRLHYTGLGTRMGKIMTESFQHADAGAATAVAQRALSMTACQAARSQPSSAGPRGSASRTVTIIIERERSCGRGRAPLALAFLQGSCDDEGTCGLRAPDARPACGSDDASDAAKDVAPARRHPGRRGGGAGADTGRRRRAGDAGSDASDRCVRRSVRGCGCGLGCTEVAHIGDSLTAYTIDPLKQAYAKVGISAQVDAYGGRAIIQKLPADPKTAAGSASTSSPPGSRAAGWSRLNQRHGEHRRWRLVHPRPGHRPDDDGPSTPRGEAGVVG